MEENTFNFNQFVDRGDKIKEISDGLLKFNNVIITGYAGTGKTVLAKMYAHQNPLNFQNINYLYGYELELGEKTISNFRQYFLRERSISEENTLWIIDEFQSIISEKIKTEIFQLSKEGRKYGHKLIIVSQTNPDKIIQSNSVTINLDGLSREQIRELISNKLEISKELFYQQRDVDQIGKILEGNPLAIDLIANYAKTYNVSFSEIFDVLNKDLVYKSPIIDNLDFKWATEKKSKIITDVRFVNSNLIEKISKQPKLIYELTPRKFEELIADLLHKQGYNITLTQETRDGGKDIFIAENKLIGNFLYYVECKRNSPKRPVGVNVVRELYGTITADRATAGIIVTSSYFSPDAIEFRDKVKNQISLIDYLNLQEWMKKIK